MLFWKRKKFDEAEIEKIVEEYVEILKTTVGKYLPRQMRRALRKNREWGNLSQKRKQDEIKEIKQRGLNNWLEENTQQVYEEIASFTPEAQTLQKELRKVLKDFKKKWDIK